MIQGIDGRRTAQIASRAVRVLLTTCPMTGHFWPMVPLGWALRSAGHEVAVASLPNLTVEVVGSGLPALIVGERADLGGLLSDVRARPPDLIVYEPMDLAGPLLAGLLGVPAVLHPFGPPMRDSVAA